MTQLEERAGTSYLLDANIMSYLIDNQSPHNNAVWRQVRNVGSSASFFVSIVTVYEIGSLSSALGLGRAWLDDLKEQFGADGPLPLPSEGVDMFTALKSRLAQAHGARVRSLAKHNVDLMVATTALVEDLTLVSNDSLFRTLAEIEPALRVEDWTQA